MRLKEPKTTCLLFQTGKAVPTGAKSEDHAKVAAQLVIKTVQKIIDTERDLPKQESTKFDFG